LRTARELDDAILDIRLNDSKSPHRVQVVWRPQRVLEHGMFLEGLAITGSRAKSG